MNDQEQQERVDAAFQKIKPKITLMKFNAITEFVRLILTEGGIGGMDSMEQRIKDFQAGYSAAEKNTLTICAEMVQMKWEEE